MNGKKERLPRSNQKQKLFCLLKILLENTDSTHDITMADIISKLKLCDVTAERKSIYDDFANLESMGYHIEKLQYGRTTHYRLKERDFEVAELKLLVDSVQSAKFITAEKSNELIKKLEKLACRPAAAQLQRQVYVSGRVKSMNNTILNNVDSIHNAIASNTKVSFQYFQWTVRKEQELKRNGERYLISPWGLLWEDENYYMVGYDSESGTIKHYRVDKMLDARAESMPREGRDKFDSIDMAAYAKKMFNMFDGEERQVDIICENSMAGVMIDRFGKDVTFLKVDDEHFKVHVKVAVSSHFISWICALGSGVRIVGPEEVLEKVKEGIRELAVTYGVLD